MSNGQVEFEGSDNSDTARATSSAAAAPPTASADYQQLSVNGYRGILPGNSRSNDDVDVDMKATDDQDTDTNGTARTRPFKWNGFKKRKLLQSTNLHKISRRAARPWYVHGIPFLCQFDINISITFQHNKMWMPVASSSVLSLYGST